MMLGGLLIAGIVVGLVSTIGLFLPLHIRFGSGGWMWTRWLVLALVGTAVLALLGAGAVLWLAHSRRIAAVKLILIVAGSLVWLPITRRWNARAHLCWSMNVLLFVVYLIFMLKWTFETPLGITGQLGALLLWGLEVFAALLACAYLRELCDAPGREHWGRTTIAVGTVRTCR